MNRVLETSQNFAQVWIGASNTAFYLTVRFLGWNKGFCVDFTKIPLGTLLTDQKDKNFDNRRISSSIYKARQQFFDRFILCWCFLLFVVHDTHFYTGPGKNSKKWDLYKTNLSVRVEYNIERQSIESLLYWWVHVFFSEQEWGMSFLRLIIIRKFVE